MGLYFSVAARAAKPVCTFLQLRPQECKLFPWQPRALLYRCWRRPSAPGDAVWCPPRLIHTALASGASSSLSKKTHFCSVRVSQWRGLALWARHLSWAVCRRSVLEAVSVPVTFARSLHKPAAACLVWPPAPRTALSVCLSPLPC